MSTLPERFLIPNLRYPELTLMISTQEMVSLNSTTASARRVCTPVTVYTICLYFDISADVLVKMGTLKVNLADIACDFVLFARQLASNNNHKIAFDMYMRAISTYPDIRENIENEFRFVLSKMNEELAILDNRVDIFANFERAIQVFPGNVELLNDIGRYLYRYSYFSEALCLFEKALSIDRSHVTIEKNFNNAKSFLIPRSLFRILNDKIRNNAYRAAIKSCVNNTTDNVMDISPLGQLALYANECNPIAITACESSHTMARLAECVMQENLAQNVLIVNNIAAILCQSNMFDTETILLTDAFDAGLFGEHILQKNLLYRGSNTRIIPGRAEFFVVGVNCHQLNSKYKLSQHMKNILNVSQLNVHTTTYFGETYYSEDVELYDDVTYICEPQSLFTIDFNNQKEVTEMLCRQLPYYAELTPTVNSEMNMVVGWFNLHLTDDIMLTTDPRARNKATAWQQAVFFDVLPREVRRNETVKVPFTVSNGKLSTLQDVGVAISRISPEALAFLNDTEYMNKITECISVTCVHLEQTVSLKEVDIVDLSPFPIFGVLMMKRGINSLTCCAKTKDEVAFLNVVLVANGIPLSKVTILVSDDWSLEVFQGKSFHIIFSNIIDFSGDIDLRRKRLVQHLKQSHLMPGGICLPASVTVMGQLVYSNNLEINNRVVDDNVDYRMAKHVNRYQVSQALYLDIARLEYEPMSEVFEVASCEGMTSNLLKVSIVKDGACNAILCWYRVQMVEGWSEICTNRRDSFVESMAHMTTHAITVFKDDEANVLTCVDPDGCFKLKLEVEH